MHVTITEAAEILGISKDTIRRRIRSGAIGAYQAQRGKGRIWMVEVPDQSSSIAPSKPMEDASSDSVHVLIELLRSDTEYLKQQIAVKDRQLQEAANTNREIRLMMQQMQAALPAPGKSWWKRLLNKG